MIDMNKLSPAPLTEGDFLLVGDVYHGKPYSWAQTPHRDHPAKAQEDARFFALARNAFAGDPESLAWWEANRERRTES